MNEEKLKEIIQKIEEKSKNMNEFEKETYYRSILMPYFSTGTIQNEREQKKC